MRKIKFRAWDKKNKKFVNGKDVSEDRIPTKSTKQGFKLMTSFVLMQYTGLKDKNGKEIYEGDIVNYHKSDIEGNVVTFKYGMFYLINDSLHHYFCSGNLEVIGNIYENKELLQLK